jgi:uncharacterized membrane protein YuzA (DUF378 family)
MATTDAPTFDRRHLPERRAAVRENQVSLMSSVDYVAMALLIIGGLNWGMVGIADVDVIASAFGVDTPVTRLIYTLVGLAALYSIYLAAKMAASRQP